MSSRPLLQLGQRLRGALDTYQVSEQLTEFVFLAIDIEGHWRLQNERDVLRRFQGEIPTLRPVVDEINDDTVPPTIVLKHLDADLTVASREQRLTRQEIKYVAKNVLQALKALHENGFVHADIKPRNILVNYNGESERFACVQLADLGGTVPVDSKYATGGTMIGTDIFRAPEVHLELPWGPASDIWSFGVTLINLIWGLNFHIFEPREPPPDDMYDVMIIAEQHRVFGPFPISYTEWASEGAQQTLLAIMSLIPEDKMRPFAWITEREITPADKAFLLKIMQLDPHDRPSAQSLLEDEWFNEKSERTVGWYSKVDWEELQSRSNPPTTQQK